MTEFTHALHEDDAVLVGSDAALIYRRVAFWIESEAQSGDHQRRGHPYTKINATELSDRFIWLTERQVRSCLKKLCDANLLHRAVDENGKPARLGRNKSDPSCWYALTEKTKGVTNRVSGVTKSSSGVTDPSPPDDQTVTTYKNNQPSNYPSKTVVVDSASAPDLMGQLSHGLRAATGNAVNWQSPSIAVLSVPLGWLMGNNPCHLSLDVLPTVKAMCAARANAPPIRSWNYFREAVFEARDNRLSPNPSPQEPRHDRTDNRYRKSNSLDAASRAALADLELPDAGAVSTERTSEPRGRAKRLAG